MCGYCKELTNIDAIHGFKFNLLPTAGFRNDRKYSSRIVRDEEDEKASIMILTDNTNGVYFEINYCPICRKKTRV